MEKSSSETSKIFLGKSGYHPLLLPKEPEPADTVCVNRKSVSYEEKDLMHILSLPNELYNSQKKDLVFALQSNHTKLSIHTKYLHFITSPPERMVDLEKSLFGKKLTSGERVSAYSIHTNNTKKLLQQGQQTTSIQYQDESDRVFACLFLYGNYVLVLLNAFIDAAEKNRINLARTVGLFGTASRNNGEMSARYQTIQILSDQMNAVRDDNHMMPDVDNLNGNVKNYYGPKVSKATNIAYYANTNNFKKVGIKEVQRRVVDVQKIKNDISVIFESAKGRFKKDNNNLSSFIRDFKQVNSTIKRTRESMSKFT